MSEKTELSYKVTQTLYRQMVKATNEFYKGVCTFIKDLAEELTGSPYGDIMFEEPQEDIFLDFYQGKDIPVCGVGINNDGNLELCLQQDDAKDGQTWVGYNDDGETDLEELLCCLKELM